MVSERLMCLCGDTDICRSRNFLSVVVESNIMISGRPRAGRSQLDRRLVREVGQERREGEL